MKKKIIIPIAAVTAVAAIYAGGAAYYNSHILPHSLIGGVRAGGADAAGIVRILNENADSYSLEITGDSTEDEIYGKEISLKIDTDSAEKAADQIIKSQDVSLWPSAFFRKSKELKVPEMTASFDESALLSDIAGLSAKTTEPVKSQNATYELDGDRYQIVDEVYGTEVNDEALEQNITTALKTLSEKLDLRESGCYIDPTVKSDNKRLNNTVKTLNKYLKADITYDLGSGKKLKVSKEDQAKWLKVNKKGRVSFDTDAMYNYVRMSLGYKYNTMGLPRKLKTQYGKTVTVKGGNYGWWINYDAEVEQLKKDVKSGKNVERDFIYRSQAANHGPAAYDYGDSYVEANLAEQHLFLIVNGKKVLESDFVSGNTSLNRGTPTGVYSITYKEKDATLNGENYSTPVKYWMPFNGNIGLHDAPWRHGHFGGEIYKTSGSHGCINLPPDVAKKIYGYVKKGFPVIVYSYDADKSDSKSAAPKTQDKKTTETVTKKKSS